MRKAVGDTSSSTTRQPICVRKRDSQPEPAPNSSTVIPGVNRSACISTATLISSVGVSSIWLNGFARWCSQSASDVK
jgi:hypothetical protein